MDHDLAKLLEYSRKVDERVKGTVAKPILMTPVIENVAPLFKGEDDPFCGNNNNRRVAEAAAAKKDVVEGKPMSKKELKALEKKQAEERKAAEAKQQTQSTDTYETGSAPWRPNA